MKPRLDRRNTANATAAGLRARRLIWWLIPLLALTACRTLAPGEPQLAWPEITIQVVNGGDSEPLIQPASGWPLTLSLRANDEKLLGIGTGSGDAYPRREHTGYLIFADPDGCPSWMPRQAQERHIKLLESGSTTDFPQCMSPPAPPWPMDESWVELCPGLNLPSSRTACQPPDQEVPKNPLDLETPERPHIKVFAKSPSGTRLEPIGPEVGSADDGYGYGPNPRLPGLVVLADVGPGVVTDVNFEPPEPRQARNLAGFFQSVTYELKDRWQRTGIVAHMNVPADLFAPVVLVDNSFCEDGCCGEGVSQFRVDGRDEECGEAWPFDLTPEVTVRAFVVNGRAPAALADLDGNEVIDVADARRAGLELLSNQAVFRFIQHDGHQAVADCNYFDFDDDGDVGEVGEVGEVGPGGRPPGPGGLVNPPR